MLNWISSIYHALTDFFHNLQAIGHWIINLFNHFTSVIKASITLLGDVVTWIPPVFGVFLLISIVVLVVYQILGRRAGGN